MTITEYHDKICALFGDLGSMSKRTKKNWLKKLEVLECLLLKNDLVFI